MSGVVSLAVDDIVWNITREKIIERMIVSPDQAWAVNWPNKPPAPGTAPDPISDFIKAGG